MKFTFLLFFCTIALGTFSQSQCQSAVAFFPRLTAASHLNPEGLPTKAIRRNKLESKELKIILKIENAVGKQAGSYSGFLKTEKIQRVMLDGETDGYMVRFSLKMEGYSYRFSVSANKKGKLISEIPFPKLDNEKILPICEAFKKGQAHPEIDSAVGITMVYRDQQLVWEIWDTGESMNVEARDKKEHVGMKKSKHHVLYLDALKHAVISSEDRILRRID